MTDKRAMEIERLVIYKHLDNIAGELEDCDGKIAFHIGRELGKMQYDLVEELKKEIERSSNDE